MQSIIMVRIRYRGPKTMWVWVTQASSVVPWHGMAWHSIAYHIIAQQPLPNPLFRSCLPAASSAHSYPSFHHDGCSWLSVALSPYLAPRCQAPPFTKPPQQSALLPRYVSHGTTSSALGHWLRPRIVRFPSLSSANTSCSHARLQFPSQRLSHPAAAASATADLCTHTHTHIHLTSEYAKYYPSKLATLALCGDNPIAIQLQSRFVSPALLWGPLSGSTHVAIGLCACRPALSSWPLPQSRYLVHFYSADKETEPRVPSNHIGYGSQRKRAVYAGFNFALTPCSSLVASPFRAEERIPGAALNAARRSSGVSPCLPACRPTANFVYSSFVPATMARVCRMPILQDACRHCEQAIKCSHMAHMHTFLRDALNPCLQISSWHRMLSLLQVAPFISPVLRHPQQILRDRCDDCSSGDQGYIGHTACPNPSLSMLTHPAPPLPLSIAPLVVVVVVVIIAVGALACRFAGTVEAPKLVSPLRLANVKAVDVGTVGRGSDYTQDQIIGRCHDGCTIPLPGNLTTNFTPSPLKRQWHRCQVYLPFRKFGQQQETATNQERSS
ncbi:unnamed protein product [Periconia digitata]|uniref:Uncharacterized protein n=1 Tax=Periconia digitata TaxID=1303443 RepID=A0A9W4UJA2_9PLEO|nr:unnamed protein product [Periconia digitata]